MRIYIDTSVIGGCFDKEFEDWSNKLFDEFRSGKHIAILSDITLAELEQAPSFVRELVTTIPDQFKEILIADEEIRLLAERYIKEGAVSKTYEEDALHIALATIHNIDVLVSWNFKHIVNLERIRKYNAVNLKLGYHNLEIRNPREVLYE